MRNYISHIFLTAVLLISFFFTGCYSSQQTVNKKENYRGTADYPPNAAPGKCYAKCKILPEGSSLEDEGTIEWREVICNNSASKGKIAKVREVLSAAGYYSGEPVNTFTQDLKLALHQYQLDNQLPIGQLDMQTLAFMQLD